MGALNGRILTTPREQVDTATESLLSVADRQRAGNIDRSAADSAEQVAEAVRDLAGGLDPAIPTGPLLPLWQALAALGHSDLCLARLAEGHIDAVRLLHEAGREPAPGAVYGVWASASGGTGLNARSVPEGWNVEGTMRFCSGAWFLDRALTVISTDAGPVLVDIDVRDRALHRHEDTWPAVGMDATHSVDVEVHDLDVPAGAAVGQPGFYLERPGFTLGGVAVAAVWLGGAHGVLNSILTTTDPERTTPHHRAHLGAMAVAIASAAALLSSLAVREEPLGLPDMTAARSAVEAAVGEVLARAPRVTGPNGLCRNARIAHQLADLEVYVRQHHAEADYELAGTHLLRTGTLLGRALR